MLDAAYELFCGAGYRATTMEAIAERAGVAVQTLYFTFHTKDELLQKVHDRTVLGDEALPPAMQPWYRAAVEEPDIAAALHLIVEGVETIFARVAPMLPVFHTVTGDPAGKVWEQGEALRRAGYNDMLTMLQTKAPPRRGLTHEDARDVMFVILGPQLYRSFVIENQWPPRRWIVWTAELLLRELFAIEPARGRH